jgi:hypothetical protein
MYYLYFALYRKLVKVSIKSDKQQWLQFIDYSLRNNPHHYWKYVSNFKGKYNLLFSSKFKISMSLIPN